MADDAFRIPPGFCDNGVMNHLILYCRAGYEGECAAEIQAVAAEHGVFGYCRAKPGTAYVDFVAQDDEALARFHARLGPLDLVFDRQCIIAGEMLEDLPMSDRIGPILDRLGDRPVSSVWVETADTEETKPLLKLCRKLAKPLTRVIETRGLLSDDPAAPRLHVFMLASDRAWVGFSDPERASPWPMGIPRLKFPAGAPSRSALKLEEAILTFLTPEERAEYLRDGLEGVDLGAAPGGWTWQLVADGLSVVAIDNGPMDEALMDTGQVEHRREDGFRFRPERPVEWMVCDMVENPLRVAELAATWLEQGWCRRSIFNLKLPMKRRHQAVEECREQIRGQLASAGIPFALDIKHLYHDRDEVTAYLRRS